MGWDDALQVVGALGGVGVVSAGISAWVGNVVSQRVIEAQKADFAKQLESHKDMLLREADRNRLMLKRQELMFERELAAVEAFLNVQSRVLPDAWSPEFNWSGSEERIAENLSLHARDLECLLQEHSVSLSKEARSLISRAKEIAENALVEIADKEECFNSRGFGARESVRKLVDGFSKAMQSAEFCIRQDLKMGSFGG